MPGVFILALIFLIIVAVCAAVRRITKAEALAHPKSDAAGGRITATVIMWIFLFGAATALLASSVNFVGTQDIGIVTSFGAPVGHVSDGLDVQPPWDQVTDMDEANQVTDSSFLVRIADSQTATATVKIRWQVDPAASDDVFKNYHNATSGVENGLLIPELNAATNNVLDGYDPLTPLATGAAAGTPGNPNTTQLAAEIQSQLAAKVSPDIHITTLVLQPLAYDKTVQARINSVTNQAAKTDVAKQSELTATAEAAANEIIAASLDKSPLVLVQQCVNAISDGDFTPPAGFSCWPGSGSGVVIPSASAATAGK